MAQFLVLIVKNNDIPALGEVGTARIYRGDHPDEATAVSAAAGMFQLGSGERLWAAPANGLTRYTNTTTTSRSIAAG